MKPFEPHAHNACRKCAQSLLYTTYCPLLLPLVPLYRLVVGRDVLRRATEEKKSRCQARVFDMHEFRGHLGVHGRSFSTYFARAFRFRARTTLRHIKLHTHIDDLLECRDVHCWFLASRLSLRRVVLVSWQENTHGLAPTSAAASLHDALSITVNSQEDCSQY